MATQFGTFNKNADVFDQSDLTKYIKENSITALQADATDGSIASKIKALEDRDPVSFADVSTAISGNISQDLYTNAEANSVVGRIKTLAARDDISYNALLATISADVDQVLLDNATHDSVLGRLSALEDTVGVINAELQNILDGNV